MDHFLICSRSGVLLCNLIGKAFLLQNHEVENRTWVAQEGHSLAVSHTADVDTIHLEKQTRVPNQNLSNLGTVYSAEHHKAGDRMHNPYSMP